MRSHIHLRLIGALLCLTALVLPVRSVQAEEVLCSTFPIWLLTRECVGDEPGISVSLLVNAKGGCPHDYVLTPQDMGRLGRADVLIVNGLGMEPFLAKALAALERRPVLVDASSGVKELLPGVADHDHDHAGGEAACAQSNPHAFASPLRAAAMARAISTALGARWPKRAEAISGRAEKFAGRLGKLAEELAKAGQPLKGRTVYSSHSSLDYMLTDAGLKVVCVQPDHGEPLSPKALRELSRRIKTDSVAAIVTQVGEPSPFAAVLARDTKTPVLELDPLASGEPTSKPGYYEEKMAANIRRLSDFAQRGGAAR